MEGGKPDGLVSVSVDALDFKLAVGGLGVSESVGGIFEIGEGFGTLGTTSVDMTRFEDEVGRVVERMEFSSFGFAFWAAFTCPIGMIRPALQILEPMRNEAVCPAESNFASFGCQF